MLNKLNSCFHPLWIPLQEDETADWKSYPVFSGTAGGLHELECHVSVLSPQCCPHPPHTHPEEELLLLLSGEVELILPENLALGKSTWPLRSGQFVYYPAGLAHSLLTTSESSANYLMFKWNGQPKNNDSILGFELFSLSDLEKKEEGREGFHPSLVFEGPTTYLDKLHCHLSTLSPSAGYDTHSDPYDVALIVVEGEVETLARRIGPHGVIFYAAGEPHGLRNPGEKTAKYIVFEFHSGRIGWLTESLAFFPFFLSKLTDPRRRIRKFRHFVRLLKNRAKDQ